MNESPELPKNDHRRIGQELDLFTFSELVGSGLPLWTPKGTIIREELDKFIWELRSAHDYQRVTIPHITKKELYETSGHWSKFSDELFKITSREDRQYALKPMNCPHHTQIFARKPHSYREMPQRYAETTMVYRDEQSGELGGLTRVLSITQDDAHTFCRQDQIKEEFLAIWDIVEKFYSAFGFSLKVRLSFRDPVHMEKYLGTPEIWDAAEKILREIVESKNIEYVEGPGEAALYGPKLDFMASNAAGREWQVATIQLDMNLPERFDLTCVNEKGEKERITMVHAAIAGSLERCTAILLEHFEGALPLWLSPVQVAVVTISEKQHAWGTAVVHALKHAGIRAELYDQNETLGKKIRLAETQKIPYIAVVGDKEVEAQAVAVRQRTKGDAGTMLLDRFVEQLKEEILNRK